MNIQLSTFDWVVYTLGLALIIVSIVLFIRKYRKWRLVTERTPFNILKSRIPLGLGFIVSLLFTFGSLQISTFSNFEAPIWDLDTIIDLEHVPPITFPFKEKPKPIITEKKT